MTLTPPEISISADIKVGKQPPVEAAARQLETHFKFTDQTPSSLLSPGTSGKLPPVCRCFFTPSRIKF